MRQASPPPASDRPRPMTRIAGRRRAWPIAARVIRHVLRGLGVGGLLVGLAWASGLVRPVAPLATHGAAPAPGSPERVAQCATTARTRDAVQAQTALVAAWQLAPLPEGLLTHLWVLTVPAALGAPLAEHAAMVHLGPWWVLAWNAAKPPTTADLYHELVHRATDEATPARRAATWQQIARLDAEGTLRADVVAAAWQSVRASVAWGESDRAAHQMARATAAALDPGQPVHRMPRLTRAVTGTWAAPDAIGRRLAVTLHYAPAFLHGIPVEVALTDDLAQEVTAYALAWACADTPTWSSPPAPPIPPRP